jgi:N-formylglutamate amidohydrolase
VQLELSWSAYMHEIEPRWDAARAAALTPLLRGFVQSLIDWKPP